MLKKNHTSALVMSFVFFVGIFTSGLGLIRSLYPGVTFDITPTSLIIGMLIIGVIVGIALFFFSRSVWVVGLTESEGFGLRGVVRWFASGLVLGGMASAFWAFFELLPDGLGGKIFDFIITLVVVDLIRYISYWIAFGNQVEWLSRMDLPKDWELEAKAIRWFILVGGLITLIVFWYWTMIGLEKSPRLLWWSVSGVVFSLSTLLIGLLYRTERMKGLETSLKLAAFSMLGLSVGIFAAGAMA